MIPEDNPWYCSRAREWDKESVASFFEKKMATTAAKNMVDSMILQVFGAHSSQVSLLWFLYWVKTSGLRFSQIIEYDNDGYFGTRLNGGAHQLCEKLADTIKTYNDAHILTSSKVVSIRMRQTVSSNHPLVITSNDNKKYLARMIVIATNPRTFTHETSIIPRLPLALERFGFCTFPGMIGKAIVSYPAAWWKLYKYSGFARNISPNPNTCVSLVYDYCGAPAVGLNARESCALVCLIFGDLAVEVGNWPEEQRKQSVLRSISLIFPDEREQSQSPMDYKDYFAFRQDPLKGAPLVYPPGQFSSNCAQKLFSSPLAHSRDPEKRPLIFFSSSEIADKFSGTMEGAFCRGKQVALQVNNTLLDIGRQKHNNFENDTEQFFMEEETGGSLVLKEDVWIPTKIPAASRSTSHT